MVKLVGQLLPKMNINMGLMQKALKDLEASDAASYINGAVIDINGGQL